MNKGIEDKRFTSLNRGVYRCPKCGIKCSNLETKQIHEKFCEVTNGSYMQ